MASAEERIKQKAKVPFNSKGFPLFADSFNCWRGLGKVTEKSLLANGWIKVEEVLQILAEEKEKWCELLKLWKNKPPRLALWEIEEVHNSLVKETLVWIKKIEGKLKELQPK